MRLIYFFPLLWFFGCIGQDDISNFSSAQLTSLLASDSTKVWNLTERTIGDQLSVQDCEQDDLLCFKLPNITQDSALVYFLTGPLLCPEQNDSIIYSGTWEAVDSSSQIVLFVIDRDSLWWTISLITSQILEISYLQEEKLVTEKYASALP